MQQWRMRKMPRDVAAVVVTYRPMPSIIRNLRSLATQLPAVFVIDNTPGSGYQRYFRMARKFPSVRVVRLGLNTGIGAALNIGMQLARAEGFDWVLTLDQDSLLMHGAARRLRCAALAADTGIVAPAIRDAYTQGLILGNVGTNAANESEVVITSGNLVRIEAWESVNGFDWQLFMDMIDFDFCLRLIQRGWKVRRSGDTELLHRWGQIRRVSIFSVFPATVRIYSPFRRFFQARNSVILLRRHAASTPWWCLGHALRLLMVSIKIHLLEKGSRKAWHMGLRAGWKKPDYKIAPLVPGLAQGPWQPALPRQLGYRRLGRDYKMRLDELPTFPLL